MKALILWVPARILLLCTRGFVQQYSSSTSNVNVFSCVHNVLMNKLAGKMCFQMQYLRGGSLKFTAFQCCHYQSPRADVTICFTTVPWACWLSQWLQSTVPILALSCKLRLVSFQAKLIFQDGSEYCKKVGIVYMKICSDVQNRVGTLQMKICSNV